ncbi:ABC transporter permease [Pseudothermotoga sp. U03pept]|uniref:ABC transporter permease n=1 Tax=Pseudothermotoga sp. U03pept TaxID=3447012 RepID=UPI0030A155D9
MTTFSRFKWFLLGTVFLIAVWYIASLFVGSSLIFPAPHSVLVQIFELASSGKLFLYLWQTFYKAFLGLFLALLIGLVLGFLIGVFRSFYELFRPLLMVIRSVPIVSWLSTVILLWGIGSKSVIFIVFITLLPLAIFNIAEGVRTVDIRLLEMAKVYSVKKKKVFVKIYLGSLLPFLLSTINLSIGGMWKAAIVSEYLIGDNGLGLQIFQSKFYVDTPKVFAFTLSAVVFGLVLELIFSSIWERYFGEKSS